MEKAAAQADVDDAVDHKSRLEEDLLMIEPNGSLRPYFTYDDGPSNFAEGEHVILLGDYMFFQEDPKTLESLLQITLVKSGHSYILKPIIEHPPAVAIELDILLKMIRRWKKNILERLSIQQRDDDDTLMKYENLKLVQSLSMMKKMLENSISNHIREIQSINNSTPIQKRALRSQMRYLVFQCKRSIFEVFNKFSKGETKSFDKMFECVDDSLKEFLEICGTLPKFSEMKIFFESRFDEDDELMFISFAESIKEKLKNQFIDDQEDEEIGGNECAKTRNSVIRDLCDPLLREILSLGKFFFLNSFTLTGIPISISYEDLSEMSYIENPWDVRAKVIFYAGDGENKNKKPTVLSNILLDDAERQTETRTQNYELNNGEKFNAIVPVFTPKLVNILKPLFHTKIFESLCTYSILKNPKAAEPYAHFAGLLVLFIEIIINLSNVDVNKNADKDREDVGGRVLDLREKLKSVLATAGAYLELSNFEEYENTLINSPHLALREKASPTTDNFQDQSENLAKPLFYLYSRRNKIAQSKKTEILYLLVLQFIDRMVSALRRNHSEIDVKHCFFNLLCNFQHNDERKRSYKESISEKFEEVVEKLIDQFKKKRRRYDFPIVEDIIRVEDTLRGFSANLYLDCEIEFKEEYLFNYKNKERIGPFNLTDLKRIALKQLNFLNEDVNRIFDAKNLFRFVCHCLTVPKSKYDTRLLDNVNILSYKEYYMRAIRDLREHERERAIEETLRRLQNNKILTLTRLKKSNLGS